MTSSASVELCVKAGYSSGAIGEAGGWGFEAYMRACLSASISATKAKQRGKRSPRTSRVSYSLTRQARVSFSVQRKAVGRRKGGRCLVGKALRKLKKGRRCVRFLRAGRPFTHTGKQGPNDFRFTGFLPGGRRLKPGPHRMVGVPIDAAGQRGAPFRATFVIARR